MNHGERAALRTGTPADLPDLDVIDPLLRAATDRAELMRSALAHGQCVLAVDGSEVLGYVVLTYDFFGYGFIPLLLVAAGRRRAGIATRLLHEAERRCERRKLFATTNRSNDVAQRLFEKHGFVASGHIENLDPGDDELVYFKALPPPG